MRIDISGTKFARKQVIEGTLTTARAIVNHDGDVSNIARDNGLFVRLPFRTGKVRTLDTNDDAWILESHLPRRFSIHVVEVVLVLRTAHARTDNVQVCQHP